MHHNEDYYLIGILSKIHGVNGELVLRLNNNLITDDIEELGTVFIEFDGLLVPFFVSGFYSKNPNSFIIKFDDIDSADQANEFVNCKVFTQDLITPETDDLISDPDSIVGYTVIDKKYGNIGKISEFLNLPNNPLLRVIKGKREILIPVNDEYILEIDDANKTIFINATEGLIDLFS